MTSPNGRQVFRRPLVAFDGSSHAEAASRSLKVLIVGGGTAALEAAFGLQRLAADRVDVTILAPDELFATQALAVLVVHLSAGDGGVGRWTVMPKTTNGALAYAQGSSHA